MNKNLLAVTLFPVVVNGSVTDPYESERDLDIITDSSIYIRTNKIKIRVSFRNYLSRVIRIVNDNCDMPVFILEKKIGEMWERVYLSDCLGFIFNSVSPTILKSEQIFDAEIYIHTPDIQDESIEGEFRLSFDLIEKESNNRLQEKYLYSNVFRIVEEI